jgi:hypothetical protein
MTGDKTKNFKTYVVEWIDASVQNGPISVDEIDPHCPHVAAGFLVKETEDYLTLGLDYAIESENWRYLLHIPQSQIIKSYQAYSMPEQGEEE